MSTIDLPRRRDAEANRESIITAAMASLAIDPTASVDTIARAAGLTRRALYGHFADRDALLRAVISRGATRFNDIADTLPDLPPALALARLANDLWRAAEHVQASAAIALDDRHAASTALALTPLRTQLRRIIVAGRADGVFRTDVDEDTAARLVEEAARAVITRMRATGPTAADLAVRAVLSIAGLSWREADDVIARYVADTSRGAA